MLFLLYRIGERRFALEARTIVEVLPLLDVQRFARPVAGITGTLHYRGGIVPVIDLTDAALGRDLSRRQSTRIIVVSFVGPGGAERMVGLVAEGATELVRFDSGSFMPTGVASDDPYAGPIAETSGGAVQRVDLEKLIPAALRGGPSPASDAAR